MSDLTDEEIGHWRSVEAGREMFGIELDHAQRHLMRAIDELQRHRSALAADRDLVRSVVVRAIDELSDLGVVARDRIATRAAEQLATAGVPRVELEIDPSLSPEAQEIVRREFRRIFGASK